MYDFSLSFQRADYLSERKVLLTAWRAYAEVEFAGRGRSPVDFSCIVDPGAPFSVIPFSLWHDRNLRWRRLGSQVVRRGSPISEIVEWQGILCDLGETQVHLVDSNTGLYAGPLTVRAKFAGQRHTRGSLERIALLGMNFVADNRLRLVLEGSSEAMSGYFSIP